MLPLPRWSWAEASRQDACRNQEPSRRRHPDLDRRSRPYHAFLARPWASEDAGFPAELRAHRLTLNAYGRGRRLRAQQYVDDGEVEAALEGLLSQPGVDYVHVHDTEAGCYDLRIERLVEIAGA